MEGVSHGPGLVELALPLGEVPVDECRAIRGRARQVRRDVAQAEPEAAQVADEHGVVDLVRVVGPVPGHRIHARRRHQAAVAVEAHGADRQPGPAGEGADVHLLAGSARIAHVVHPPVSTCSR